jgi:PAS domain S-box-containing protein
VKPVVQNMSPAKIMIVEDEPITAEHLQEILTDLGYAVTATASTGADAIREAEQTSPDLILMDIRIKGDIDGIETARVIRERFDIPVVYLTAHADADTLSRAKLAEPLGYIIKPFQEPELQASIEMALHKQRADRQSKQARERFRAALGAIGQGVICIDAAGSVTLLNPASEAWTGWQESDALGRNINDVFRLVPSDAGGSIRRALSEGMLATLDEPCSVVARDGAERSIGGSVAPIHDHTGLVTGAVIVFGEANEAIATKDVPSTAATPGIDGFEMVIESAAMKQVMNFARRVAASEVSTVLIEGDSGTGKDLIAKYLHYQSRRRSQPFLAVNCAAIPETLLESELFGYEKGAFTDARQQKRGILELASGGTVFLDEVGEMPLALQAKLLRVLEDQAFRRLGGLKDTRVDLRVITATNQNLREAIRQGRFRLDLYYRLNVIQLVIPPLRQRKEDSLPLVNHFLNTYNARFRRNIKGVSPQAASVLLAHDWPGNVREVRNTIERAMVLEETPWVQPSSLGIACASADTAAAGGKAPVATAIENMHLEEAERAMVLNALERTGWNQSQAARVLGITRDTLRYRMKKFDLTATKGSGC